MKPGWEQSFGELARLICHDSILNVCDKTIVSKAVVVLAPTKNCFYQSRASFSGSLAPLVRPRTYADGETSRWSSAAEADIAPRYADPLHFNRTNSGQLLKRIRNSG